MRSVHCLCLLLIVGELITGCSSNRATMTPTWAKIQPPSPTSILPTASPTLIPRPTLTATLTPPVTLEFEQAKETISARLREPLDCPAPCFWGITPGETTLGEASNIFVQLGLDLQFTLAEGGNKFYSGIYDLGNGLKISPILTLQDNIVKNLQVGITPTKQKAGASREWLTYSPETLIGRYGAPSKVNFILDWGPSSFFEMDMYFDKFDLIVQYIVYGFIGETYPQVCPLTVPFEHISLWLGEDPRYPPHDIVLLEKATSLTLEQFSELMIGDPNKACFTLKPEAFQ